MKVDLSKPDNTLLVRGRPLLVELLWYYIGSPLFKSYVIPSSAVKVAILRIFGAKVGNGVYIKPGVKVKFPWKLEIGDHCWIGEGAWVDNMDSVSIGSNVCISQEVYLCTGNHDWSHPNLRLYCAPITIEDGAWVAARSVVFSGVTIGEAAVCLGCSVVRTSIPAGTIYGGNPAAFIKYRKIISNGRMQLALRQEASSVERE